MRDLNFRKTPPPKKRRSRVVSRNKKERFEAISIGSSRRGFTDIYVKLLDISWLRLVALVIIAYLNINLFFTFCYLATGNGIENARPGSFEDAFFFSVQTLATIGYGKMYPQGLAANLLVTVEALTGYCFLAVMTGLIFSKVSRPTARVVFSDVAVMCPYNGVTHLMLRMANERGNRIVDAKVRLSLLRMEVSQEGNRMRRFNDLALVRDELPMLQLTWTIMHPIDEKSPLFNITKDKLQESDVEIIVSLSGLDESFSQVVHARYSYLSDEIECDAVFEDIVRRTEDDRLEINYNLIHKTRKIA